MSSGSLYGTLSTPSNDHLPSGLCGLNAFGSNVERSKLKHNVRGRKTPVRLVERSKIVLLAHEGKTNQQIAKQLGKTEHTVGRWRNRFAQQGLSGIEKELPRGENHGGKNTQEQAILRAKIIEMTTKQKPDNATPLVDTFFSR